MVRLLIDAVGILFAAIGWFGVTCLAIVVGIHVFCLMTIKSWSRFMDKSFAEFVDMELRNLSNHMSPNKFKSIMKSTLLEKICHLNKMANAQEVVREHIRNMSNQVHLVLMRDSASFRFIYKVATTWVGVGEDEEAMRIKINAMHEGFIKKYCVNIATSFYEKIMGYKGNEKAYTRKYGGSIQL